MNKKEMENYFSEWFEIISFSELKLLNKTGDPVGFILRPDGSDASVEGYTLEELEREHENGALFGLEKIVKEDNKIKIVTPAEFITAWNEMEKYYVNNDGDNDENSYYNRIINQSINIELPLLGIKTELFWCPPTVECLEDMFKRMIDETYFDLLVEKEQCYQLGSGVWLAEIPFEYGDKSFVMVVDNEHSEVWAIYHNVLKGNGKYESVEYDELMEFTGNSNNILPDFQIYYIRALQLLANRKG